MIFGSCQPCETQSTLTTRGMRAWLWPGRINIHWPLQCCEEPGELYYRTQCLLSRADMLEDSVWRPEESRSYTRVWVSPLLLGPFLGICHGRCILSSPSLILTSGPAPVFPITMVSESKNCEKPIVGRSDKNSPREKQKDRHEWTAKQMKDTMQGVID